MSFLVRRSYVPAPAAIHRSADGNYGTAALRRRFRRFRSTSILEAMKSSIRPASAPSSSERRRGRLRTERKGNIVFVCAETTTGLISREFKHSYAQERLWTGNTTMTEICYICVCKVTERYPGLRRGTYHSRTILWLATVRWERLVMLGTTSRAHSDRQYFER